MRLRIGQRVSIAFDYGVEKLLGLGIILKRFNPERYDVKIVEITYHSGQKFHRKNASYLLYDTDLTPLTDPNDILKEML